jgi:fused signal recognition particle receptor
MHGATLRPGQPIRATPSRLGHRLNSISLLATTKNTMGIFDRITNKGGGATDSGEPTAEAQGGLFARFKRGLEKTARLLNTDIRDLFKQEGRLVDEEFLKELFAILVKTDMGATSAAEIRDQVRSDYRGRVVHLNEILDTVRAKIRQQMAQPEEPLRFADQGPTIIMVVGVNGSGKTTSIAKLAQLCQQQGRQVVLAAGDTFRAAAVQQLTVWADRIGAEIVKGESGADPASVAHRAVSRAVETNADVCIVDTAGRLQTQTNLMQELGKIRRVISKQIPEAPHEVLLVMDATAGQNGISQAQGFSDAACCTGIVLAKLDGTAKGGVVIPIRRQFDLPVKYVGVGERPEDLAPFDADEFVHAMFAEFDAEGE